MSDNGGSDHDKASEKGMSEWFEKIGFDNSYENMGNGNSFVSYGYNWAQVIVTPHWGAKSTVAEGGTRSDFMVSYAGVIKPGTTTNTFTTVRDITPTILDYAGIRQPGSSYKGESIHPISGKSMRRLWEGNATRVHSADEPMGFELYGTVNKAMYLGDWKVLKLGDEPWGKGQAEPWKLFNLSTDTRELNDLSQKYPDQLRKLVGLYEKYEKDIGFVPALAAEHETEKGLSSKTLGGQVSKVNPIGQIISLLSPYRTEKVLNTSAPKTEATTISQAAKPSYEDFVKYVTDED